MSSNNKSLGQVLYERVTGEMNLPDWNRLEQATRDRYEEIVDDLLRTTTRTTGAIHIGPGQSIVVEAEVQYTPETAPEMFDACARIMAGRRALYGSHHSGHEQLGIAWTALLNTHYDGLFAKGQVIPPSVVALMMQINKTLRASRPGMRPDDFMDGVNYMGLAYESRRIEVGQSQV